MRDFITKKIKEIQRRKKHIGEGKGGVKAFDILAGLGCIAAGALSVVVTPLVGVGTMAIGAACLYNYKTIRDKEKLEREMLDQEEQHLNRVLNQGGVTNTDDQNKIRKDALVDLADDLKDANVELAKTDDLKSKVGIGLGLSFIPLFAWAGPVTLALTGGFAIGKFLLDRQSKNQHKEANKIQLQIDVINDDLGVASKMPQPQQAQPQQTQPQQNGNGRTRGNTRARQQTQQQGQQQRQQQGQQQGQQQTQQQGQQQRPQPTRTQQRPQPVVTTNPTRTQQRPQPVVTTNPTRTQQQGNPTNVNAVNNFVNGLNGVDEFDMLRTEYTIRLSELADATNRVLADLFSQYNASSGRMSASEYYSRVARIQRQYEDATRAVKTEYYQKVRQLAQQKGVQYTI